jgi:riboflavin synthase
MFTGIIESTGAIKEILTTGTNKSFWVSSPLAGDLKVDQSLSHNGVCLTIEEIKDGMYRVTAIEETLVKTNLGNWQKDDIINLERCMQMNGRLDGHIVQGHVDCTAKCTEVLEKAGSWEFSFVFPEKFAALIIEKGSVCVNGISLTAFNVSNNSFTVAIVPYTYNHTHIKNLVLNNLVNIEWDLLGKYILRQSVLSLLRQPVL